MEGYVRFSSTSPPANPSNGNSQRRFSFQEAPSVDSTDSPYSPDSPHQPPPDGGATGMWGRSMCPGSWSWLSPPPLQQLFQRWRTPSPRTAFQSNYMTLVPLSDDRLKPRRTKLIVGSVLVLALLAITGVFLLVPRGISVGTIEVHSTKMTFNSTTKTYRIILQAEVPIFNPNYLQASVTGNVTVSFYDAEAGWGALGPAMLSARSNPQVLSVNVDASNLPRRYTRVVYDQCFGFPRILVFFLLGTFQTSYLGYKTDLPSVDTYFLLDCSGAQDLGAANGAKGSSNSSSSTGSKQLSRIPHQVKHELLQRHLQQWPHGQQQQQLTVAQGLLDGQAAGDDRDQGMQPATHRSLLGLQQAGQQHISQQEQPQHRRKLQ